MLDSAGNATAVWDRWNGSDTVVESAYRGAGGSWSDPKTLSEAAVSGSEVGAFDAASPSIAVDSRGDVSVVWESYDGAESAIQATYRPPGGEWQAPVDIATQPAAEDSEPWVAVDSAGDVTVVWKDSEKLESAYRPAEAAWQKPATIATGALGSPRAAVDSEGDATAAWMHYDGSRYVTETAYRPAGESWETPTELSEPGEEGGDPQVALDSGGDTIVVWDGHRSPYSDMVRAAYRPAGGSWHPAESLSSEGEQVQALRVALDASRDAIVAWSGWSKEAGGYTTVHATYRPAGGSWESAQQLSAAGENAFPSDLAFDAAGNAAIVWQRFDGAHEIMQAEYRPVGGTWGAVTNISESGKDATDAALVLGAPGDTSDAADGDATIVYASWEGEGCGAGEGPDCTKHQIVTVQAVGYDIHRTPTEAIEVPATGTVGQPVEVSVPTEDVYSPTLEFGDGTSSASGLSARHTYDSPGVYTVSFSGTEVLGYRSTSKRTIAIAAAPGSGSSPGPGSSSSASSTTGSPGSTAGPSSKSNQEARPEDGTTQEEGRAGATGPELPPRIVLGAKWRSLSLRAILASGVLRLVCHMNAPGTCAVSGADGRGSAHLASAGRTLLSVHLTPRALARLRDRRQARFSFTLSATVAGRRTATEALTCSIR